MKAFLLALALVAACPTFAAGQKCGISEKICVEGPETRLIDGMEVTRACWKWGISYGCIQPNSTQDTCQPLVERGGVQASSNCVQGVNIDGVFNCVDEHREYTFTRKAEGTKTQLDCSGKQYCLNGNCFDVGSSPDPDFARAVTGMEALRQAGAYMDPNTFELFKGQDNRCSKNVVQNCCRGTNNSATGLTNMAIMGGSAYVFDVLGVGSGSSAIYALPFDPTTFALAMAVMVVQELLKCDKPEVLLAVKREKRLCHHVGEYCSKKLKLGFTSICISKKETYCCYNSKIARIINEYARSKMGLGWGSPEAPACNGLTVLQFQSLDLSAIDFSEMYEDIVPKQPNEAAIAAGVENKVKCYFGNCNGGPAPASCTAPWGTGIPDGGSVTAFQAASAQMPATCVGEQRVCNKGALSGSYQHQSCNATCSSWEEKLAGVWRTCQQCPNNPQPVCEVVGACDHNGNNCVLF